MKFKTGDAWISISSVNFVLIIIVNYGLKTRGYTLSSLKGIRHSPHTFNAIRLYIASR
jgi:hypothetical protein